MKTYGTIGHVPEGPGGMPLWTIKAEPQVMVRLKRFFPRIQKHRSGQVTLVDTPEIAAELSWFCAGRWPLDFEDADARNCLRRQTLTYEEGLEAVERVLSGDSVEADTGWLEPSDHYEKRAEQYQAADLCMTTSNLMLADLVGKGKTFTSLLLLRNPAALPMLVVTLAHLPEQWLEELNEAFPMLRGHILRKGTPYDISAKREMKGYQPDVLITNYAKLDGWSDHLAGKIRTVVFDEVHELRHATTDRYKAAGHIADLAAYRIGLSGTPIYNYGGEIFNVMDILSKGCLGSREEFLREWGRPMGNGRTAVRDPEVLGRHLRGEGIFLRRGWKSDELDPKVIRFAIDSSKDVYEAEAAGALELAKLVVSSNPKEAFTARGQLDMKLREATGVAKAPYVADFTRMLLEEDPERRVLLFGWHYAVYSIWEERLKDFEPVMYRGRESKAQKKRSENAFLEGESRLMIMSLRSGAGLDGLQEACNVAVFGELDWSPAQHKQALGRLDPRRGSKGEDAEQPALGYFLVSDTGADPELEKVLNLKRMQSERMLDPDAPLLEEVEDHGDKIRHLAEAYLAEHGEQADAREKAAVA